MTGKDLLLALGTISPKYYDEGENGTLSSPRKRFSWRRPLLAAALIGTVLLLAGCAVLYALRLQDMQVGQHRSTLPTYYDDEGNVIYAYDENGNVVVQETMPPIPLLSLQGANTEALSQWLAFTSGYDPNLTIFQEAEQAEKAGTPWDIPENYRVTYHCYSPEMAAKLDEIAETYHLRLLSAPVHLLPEESGILLEALGISRLFRQEAPVSLEYEGSTLYPEGTFGISFALSAQGENWQCSKNSVYYRYSKKAYFDPQTGIYDPEALQWNFTREDGTRLLLTFSGHCAHIYADLPDGFVSISLETDIQMDGREQTMQRAQIEQVAQWLDLSLRPQKVDLEKLRQQQTAAAAQRQAQQAAANAPQYSQGYAAYIQQRLDAYPEGSPTRDRLTYALYDLNGDGIQELITHAAILSLHNGESYVYFSTEEALVLGTVALCQDGVVAVQDPLSESRYYFQPGDTGMTFLIGLEEENGRWYLVTQLPAWPSPSVREETTAQQAQALMEAHPQAELPWQLMTRYGQPAVAPSYTDPYAAYIARQLDWDPNAGQYTYAKMDLDADGIDELLCWEIPDGTGQYRFRVHTIHAGTRRTIGDGFDHICEGSILEVSAESGDGGAYYQYYKLENGEAVPTDKVVQDPTTRYWGMGRDGSPCKTVWESEAREVLASHKRITPDRKPFAQYPLQ